MLAIVGVVSVGATGGVVSMAPFTALEAKETLPAWSVKRTVKLSVSAPVKLKGLAVRVKFTPILDDVKLLVTSAKPFRMVTVSPLSGAVNVIAFAVETVAPCVIFVAVGAVVSIAPVTALVV